MNYFNPVLILKRTIIMKGTIKKNPTYVVSSYNLSDLKWVQYIKNKETCNT